MKREFLRSLVLDEKIVDQIMAEYSRELLRVQKDQQAAKKEAEEWQQKYNQREEQFAREQESQVFESTLNQKLTEAGARSVQAVGALLNREAISMDEGTMTGLEEQITSLQQEHSYLFSQQETPPPKVVAPARGGGEDQRSLFSVIRAAAGL